MLQITNHRKGVTVCMNANNEVIRISFGDLERLTLLYFVVQQRTDKTHLLVVESLESPLSIHNRKEPEERR